MRTFRQWARVLVVMACPAPVLSGQVAADRPQPAPSVAVASAAKPAPDKPASHQGHRRSQSRRSGVSNPPPAQVEKPANPPAAAAPQAPLPASQLPPTAPQIIYRDGMLTVVANNSTLEDILNQVRLKTGASIEFPSSLSQERVVARVGPAPAPQVLAALLNGSRFDYILVGANGRPDLLQKAIITSKESGDTVAATPPPPPVPQPRRGAAPQAAAGEEDADTQDDTAEQPEETPQPQPGQPLQPPQQAQPAPQPAPSQPYSAQPGEQQPPQVKTPEQLLQELQRIQQLQQQQQQQAPPQ